VLAAVVWRPVRLASGRQSVGEHLTLLGDAGVVEVGWIVILATTRVLIGQEVAFAALLEAVLATSCPMAAIHRVVAVVE